MTTNASWGLMALLWHFELDDEVESTLWNEKLYSDAANYIYTYFSLQINMFQLNKYPWGKATKGSYSRCWSFVSPPGACYSQIVGQSGSPTPCLHNIGAGDPEQSVLPWVGARNQSLVEDQRTMLRVMLAWRDKKMTQREKNQVAKAVLWRLDLWL